MIHYLSLRTNAQATEDLEKVRSTIKLFIGPYKNENSNSRFSIISEYITKGHYGNQIILLKTVLNKKKDCQYVIDLIKQHLGKKGITQLISQLPQRIDDNCNLYIRFDKQDAYQGKLIMTSRSDAIALRIKLKVYPAKKDEALRIARKLFSIED